MGANPPKAAPRDAPTRKKAAVERRMLGAVVVTNNTKLVQRGSDHQQNELEPMTIASRASPLQINHGTTAIAGSIENLTQVVPLDQIESSSAPGSMEDEERGCALTIAGSYTNKPFEYRDSWPSECFRAHFAA